MNEVKTDLHNQPRQWNFLTETISLTVSSNTITLPTGAIEIVYIKGDNFYLTSANKLTDREVYETETSDIVGTLPEGYTQDNDGVVTFYPGASGTVEVKYEYTLGTDLTDSETDTIYPKELENLFVTGVHMHYYDYDKDGRYGKEVVLYENELAKIKAWDNQKSPKIKYNTHGYIKDTI